MFSLRLVSQIRLPDAALESLWPRIAIGASPRASVSILMASRAAAAVSGREYVTPDDVRRVALPALRHRIRLMPDALIHGISADSVLEKLFESVGVPRG